MDSNKYKLLIVLLLAQLSAACSLSDNAKEVEVSSPLEKVVDLADFFSGHRSQRCNLRCLPSLVGPDHSA